MSKHISRSLASSVNTEQKSTYHFRLKNKIAVPFLSHHFYDLEIADKQIVTLPRKYIKRMDGLHDFLLKYDFNPRMVVQIPKVDILGLLKVVKWIRHHEGMLDFGSEKINGTFNNITHRYVISEWDSKLLTNDIDEVLKVCDVAAELGMKALIKHCKNQIFNVIKSDIVSKN